MPTTIQPSSFRFLVSIAVPPIDDGEAELSPAVRRGVELGHELAVGGPRGSEFLAAFFHLEPQVIDLRLQIW